MLTEVYARAYGDYKLLLYDLKLNKTTSHYSNQQTRVWVVDCIILSKHDTDSQLKSLHRKTTIIDKEHNVYLILVYPTTYFLVFM